MIWILFATLFLLGAAGVIYGFIKSTFFKPNKKEKLFDALSIAFLAAGIIGLIVSNWRIVLLLVLFSLSLLIIAMAITDSEILYIILLIFTLTPGIILGICSAGVEVASNYSEYSLESETNLVSLGDEVTVDVYGQGTRRYVYVQSEAENAYTYRYETTSDIDGSKVYKKEVVTGNVEEKEVDGCETPVLKTYVRHRVATLKNFYTGKTREEEKEADYLYVFVVPTGSIQKTINLK